jgi:hypothetical protein
MNDIHTIILRLTKIVGTEAISRMWCIYSLARPDGVMLIHESKLQNGKKYKVSTPIDNKIPDNTIYDNENNSDKKVVILTSYSYTGTKMYLIDIKTESDCENMIGHNNNEPEIKLSERNTKENSIQTNILDTDTSLKSTIVNSVGQSNQHYNGIISTDKESGTHSDSMSQTTNKTNQSKRKLFSKSTNIVNEPLISQLFSTESFESSLLNYDQLPTNYFDRFVNITSQSIISLGPMINNNVTNSDTMISINTKGTLIMIINSNMKIEKFEFLFSAWD